MANSGYLTMEELKLPFTFDRLHVGPFDKFISNIDVYCYKKKVKGKIPCAFKSRMLLTYPRSYMH